MQEIGFIKALYRYPVKSMSGEACDELAVDARGVVGDRRFAVVDENGKIGSGKSTRRFTRMDGLIDFQGRLTGEGAAVQFSDGSRLGCRDEAIHRKLSEALGRRVTLEEEAGTPHLDAGPIHIVSENQLKILAARAKDSTVCAARFRPNLLIVLHGAALPESEWLGRSMQIGKEIQVVVEAATERCRMVAMRQGGLLEDSGIVRRIAREMNNRFGVYARPRTYGSVTLGDKLFLLN